MRPLRRVALLPALTLLVLTGPVLAGLAGTVLPAFGIGPGGVFGLQTVRALFAWPGFWEASRLSLTTGLGATALALLVVTLVVAGWHGTRAFRWLERGLSPLLSVPHAAAAFGLAFLIAPSGWIVRAVSPEITGWDRPPDVLVVQDPAGLALMAGLVAKEIPFLLLMTLAALGQADVTRSMTVARALGYGRVMGWLKVVFPRIYAQIRLPVYAVLAYSMSVVDVAVILGPNTPPTLSVQITRWISDPDLSHRLLAAAAALWQLTLVLAALALWRLGEAQVARAGRRWAARGARGRGAVDLGFRALGLTLGAASALAVLAGLAALTLWSVAGFWAFPEAWPDTLTWRSWARHGPGLGRAAVETAMIAASATLIALVLCLGCLETEHRRGLRLGTTGTTLLYLPLLVPQTAFLPGLATLLIWSGWDQSRGAVILAHVVFVLPYVFLSLGDPWRAWDTRHATIAAALGHGAGRVLWQVRLPMLLAP
ncbi:MAG: ABC transporter permease, partial [Pseudomonadota bacterium]